MERNTILTPHELLEVHELLASEMSSVRRLQDQMDMVQEQELKTFLQTSLTTKERRISQLQLLLGNALQS